MHLIILLALTAAQKSIDIENAYFVPDKLTADALAEAARRGVRVRVVVPGKYTDARVGRWAAHALYGDLLNAGVELYEYQPTMIRWTSVGSANFDDRSFRPPSRSNTSKRTLRYRSGWCCDDGRVAPAHAASTKALHSCFGPSSDAAGRLRNDLA